MKVNTKTIKNKIIYTAVATACLFGATAQAQPTATLGNADHIDLESLSVSVVQPVASADATTNDEMFRFMSHAETIKQMPGEFHKSLPELNAAMFVERDAGLGFSGQSTKMDIVSLKIGYMMGALPLVYKKDKVKYNNQLKIINKVANSTIFDVTTRQQMKRFLTSSTKLNGKAYTAMMSALSKSMAASKTVSGQRKHAYMLVGLWVTLNTMSLATNNTPSYLSNIGNILANMLEKDAAFGSSDKTLARHIRTITKETKKALPNKKAVYGALRAMTKVKKDA